MFDHVSEEVDSILLGFYRVLPSFTVFYRARVGLTSFYSGLPSFIGFYRVLLSFTVFSEFVRILLGITVFFRV